jgi:hypothetical protein
MRSFIALFLVLSATEVVFAAPSRDEALTAIATLESNLLSDAAINASRVVTQFAQDSEEVAFTLGPDTVPWILEERAPNDADDAVYSMLLAVYFAGNAKSQLLRRKVEDDPYSGWIATIRAYRQIQTKRQVVITSLEKLSEMEAKGTLKTHAREVKSEEQKLNQAPQLNAGSRPSSGDSSASETPSSLGPRG